MSSAFYRSVPRGANGASSNPVLEKKLDDILLAIGEQKNRMCTLEENGTKTLKSVENLEERMIVLEDKSSPKRRGLVERPPKEAEFLQNFW